MRWLRYAMPEMVVSCSVFRNRNQSRFACFALEAQPPSSYQARRGARPKEAGDIGTEFDRAEKLAIDLRDFIRRSQAGLTTRRPFLTVSSEFP